MKHCFKIFENSIKFEKKNFTKFEKSAKSQKPKTIFSWIWRINKNCEFYRNSLHGDTQVYMLPKAVTHNGILKKYQGALNM